MHSASDEVRAAIVAAGGAIRFDEFMGIALYGQHGFYTTGGQAGRRGDFITSAEVGPLFGAVLARWIDMEWRRLGEPDDFTIVECGAGPGTLARAVLASAPQWRDHYVTVEVSDHQRQQHPPGVHSLASWPQESPRAGVVVANELLDNLPFRLAVFDGGWREVMVSAGRDEGFVETTIAPDPAWDWLPSRAAHGVRVPIQDQAADWVRSALRMLRQGSVTIFDYLTATTAELSVRPWREWLRTYSAQGRGGHYLRDPGTQDITAQVCVDQLPLPQVVGLQRDVLRRWGIDELVEEGRQAWIAAASRPDLAAMTMRSRTREAEALLEPGGLGGFGVASWLVEGSSDHSL